MGFDEVTLGSRTAGGDNGNDGTGGIDVPEPGSIVMLGLGLLLVGTGRSRQRRRIG